MWSLEVYAVFSEESWSLLALYHVASLSLFLSPYSRFFLRKDKTQLFLAMCGSELPSCFIQIFQYSLFRLKSDYDTIRALTEYSKCFPFRSYFPGLTWSAQSDFVCEAHLDAIESDLLEVWWRGQILGGIVADVDAHHHIGDSQRFEGWHVG